MKHERFDPVLRFRQSYTSKLLAHPVNAFAEFLHKTIIPEKGSDPRVAGKMDVAHRIQAHEPGKCTGAFHTQAVVK